MADKLKIFVSPILRPRMKSLCAGWTTACANASNDKLAALERNFRQVLDKEIAPPPAEAW